MINISLNATRVKQELSRIATGIMVASPVVACFVLLQFLIKQGFLTKELVSAFLITTSGLFLCWSLGGLFETIREQKRMATIRAFEKLGHKNDDNN